jgi:hypothetical protein
VMTGITLVAFPSFVKALGIATLTVLPDFAERSLLTSPVQSNDEFFSDPTYVGVTVLHKSHLQVH